MVTAMRFQTSIRILCFFLWLLTMPTFVHAAVSVVLPNGGECLTVGQSYAVTITFTANHTALYYKTDGTQPEPANGGSVTDPTVIFHPENQTTYSWTPGSSHISETGRIWVEGHLANHNTNSEWDQSNANFAVRSSCAATPAGGTGAGAVFNAFPPTPILPLVPSPTSIRWNFKAPGYDVGEVRLLKKENFAFFEIMRQTQSTKANLEGFIVEANLLPNVRYTDRYLQVAKEGALANVSDISNPHYPTFTLIETPQALDVISTSPTIVVLRVKNQLSGFDAALSGVWFENVTASTMSGWQKLDHWTFTGLESDTLYQFRAKARNGDGVETLFSEIVSVITAVVSPLTASTVSPITQPAPSPMPQASEGPVPPVPSGVEGSTPEGLLRVAGDPRVWRVEGGKRRHIPSPEVFLSYGFDWGAVTVVSPEELNRIPESGLLRVYGKPEVWLVEMGWRRHIPNPDVFSRHGFAWDDIFAVNELELSSYAPRYLFQAQGDARVWFVENGIRRWISSPEAFGRRGYRWEDVGEIPLFELEAYQEKEPLS